MNDSDQEEEKKEALEERTKEALTLAGGILARDPGNPDALSGMGIALLAADRRAEAIIAFERALAHAPGRADITRRLCQALDNEARRLADAGRFDEASGILERAIDLLPGEISFYQHLAFLLCEMKKFPMALAIADQALEKAPEAAGLLDTRGLALSGLGKYKEAIASLRRAIEIAPDQVAAHINLGAALLADGAIGPALEKLEEALGMDDADAKLHNNLGLARMAGLDLDGAVSSLGLATEIDPDYAEAHYNLSMALLMKGNFAAGWEEYEWRWQCPDFPSTRRQFPYPRWAGEDLSGRCLLVWSEQGVGDEMMFANPIPAALEAGVRLVIECNPRFVPLFARSFPGALVVERSDPPDPRIAEAGAEMHTPMGSLGRFLRAGPEEFPLVPGFYLVADGDQAAACRARYDGWGEGLKIGLSWRSGNQVVGAERSASLDLWDGVLSQPGCLFVNLQYGEVEADIAAVEQRLGVKIHCDETIDPLASMDDWAAQIAAMDLVISVDNSTVQLSGALGIATWTLLSHVPEWRWQASGAESPWHPFMRLFRQPARGAWGEVFEEAAAALDRELAG